jgi:hypothetical protein
MAGGDRGDDEDAGGEAEREDAEIALVNLFTAAAVCRRMAPPVECAAGEVESIPERWAHGFAAHFDDVSCSMTFLVR